jgi:hypothetical protein
MLLFVGMGSFLRWNYMVRKLVGGLKGVGGGGVVEVPPTVTGSPVVLAAPVESMTNR